MDKNTTLTKEEQDLEDRFKAEAWANGVLSWKLHSTQERMYEAFHACADSTFIINCSRRLGKSYLLLIIAFEIALQYENKKIFYVAPSGKMVKNIITPIIRKLLEDCPEGMRPKWKQNDGCWVFPTGSQLHIAGADAERIESLRGGDMDLSIVDEAGLMDDLEYIVNDVILPMGLHSGGRVIIASTPPYTPSHPFREYAEAAEANGNYFKATIYDNPLLTPEKIARAMVGATKGKIKLKDAVEIAKNKGNIENTTWRREYMAEFVTDSERAVVPEFSELESELVIEVERPQFFDTYVGMDIGVRDFTAVLFGYWDFLNARLVIEDEIVLNGPKMNTFNLAEGIKVKERELYNGKRPASRWCDVELLVIADLQQFHGLTFNPTRKDNLEAAVNNVRIMVQHKQIVIHPRCKNLIAHLKYAIWEKSRSTFARSADHGHFDCVAALVYLARNINRNRNPIPAGYGLDINHQFIPANIKKRKMESELTKLLGPRKKT